MNHIFQNVSYILQSLHCLEIKGGETMEAIVIGLAAKAVDILTPYLKKGAEKFAYDVGEVAAEKVKGLLGAIKKRLTGDKVASENFSQYEIKPEVYKPVIQDMLKEKMLNDKEMTKDLDNRLRELGPTLEIIMKMNVVEGEVVGVKSKKMSSGKAKVNQEIGDVKSGGKVIGVDIDQIGEEST